MANAVKETKLELTQEQMIKEVRVLRTNRLFVSNMLYVDAVLTAYDKLLQATNAGHLVDELAIEKLNELRQQVLTAEKVAEDWRIIAETRQRELDAATTRATIHVVQSSDKETRITRIMEQRGCTRGNALKVYKQEQIEQPATE